MPGVILRYRNLGAGTARGRMYSADTAGVNVRADTAQAAGSCGTSTPPTSLPRVSGT